MCIARVTFVFIVLAIPGVGLGQNPDVPDDRSGLPCDVHKQLEAKIPDINLRRPLPFEDGTRVSGFRLVLSSPRIKDGELKCLSRVPQLADLDLSRSSVTDAGMAYIGELHTLQALDLNDTAITDEAFRHLSTLKHLRWLAADTTAITGDCFRHLADLPQLQWICVYKTQIRSLNLNGGFPKLLTVDLSDCPVEEIRIAGLPCLHKLTLYSKELSRVHLADLPELQALCINRCDEGQLEPRGRVFLKLSKLPNLISLAVYARIDAADLSPLDTMHKLRFLYVDGVDASGSFLEKAGRLPSLEELGLRHMENVTNEHLACLAGSQNLKALDLGWGGGFDGESLRHLVGLKGLEKLWFTSAIPLTDQQAEYLSRLRNLQLLSLNSSCRLQGHALRHLAGLTSLRNLQIHGSYGRRRGIRDDDLKYLCDLSALQELDLMGNALEGPGLRYLAGLRELHTLNLSMNPLTSDGLHHLKQLPSLRTLSIEYVPLTESSLESLKQLTFLETLNISYGPGDAERVRQLKDTLTSTKIY
jgi:Leucine-rich repeat (LRR) protein